MSETAIREHGVTITLSLPKTIPHHEVQARVLRAVGEEFKNDREDTLVVSGFDRRKLEAELAVVIAERNELHSAWVAVKEEAERFKADIKAETARYKAQK